MPNIRIKEFDKTSPGTPGSYANYSVLIPGFMNRVASDDDKIQPDANGVYEFSSAQDFKDTIGWDSETEGKAGVAKIKITDDSTEEHYGKRMALELLNLGYTVIYKPMTSVFDLNDEKFWEDFYDKASYDFRFVCHGLLSSNLDADEKTAYETAVARLAVIEEDIKKFAEITKIVEASADFKAIVGDSEEAIAAKNVLYEAEYNKYIAVAGEVSKEVVLKEDGSKWFTTGINDLQYGTYAEAKAALSKNLDDVYPALVAQENLIKGYDSQNITSGVINNVNGIIAKLACYKTDKAGTTELVKGRGDCTALIELDEKCYTESGATRRPENLIIDGINGMSSIDANVGPYCAMTVPSPVYNINSAKIKFPGAFHYLACFMNSLSSGFAEWYAAAGYTRGVSSYVIDHTSVKLGEIAINALEPRNYKDGEVHPKFACNVIANFRGSYYLWGNRTAAPVQSANGGGDLTAEHFLNIRQLCSTIKKQLYVACRRFTFDPNSDTLWYNFVNAITPTLDAMKADQGVRDYKVLKVFTDKKATLKAKIRIIPIEAVEDFDIEISLEDSFGGVSVNAN